MTFMNKEIIYCFIFSSGVIFLNIAAFSHKMITNKYQNDGFGSQFQTIIATAIYAELHNMRFIYTPFQAMDHNYECDTNFLNKKEWLINFLDNFEVIKNDQKYYFHTIDAKVFFDKHVMRCVESDSFQKIKKFFRENKGIEKCDNFNIAVHVRRPNSHDNRLTGSDVPDKIYLQTIFALRIIFAKYHPIFHIYSQGNVENFERYQSSDTILHLNEPLEKTFIGMVYADVLVTAPSSFSYVAGWLSEGQVYYIPFWHSPLPWWISVGNFLKDDFSCIF